MEQSTVQRIQQAYGEKYSHSLMQESKREVSLLLSEDTEQPSSVRERLRQAEQKKQARGQQSKKKNRDSGSDKIFAGVHFERCAPDFSV